MVRSGKRMQVGIQLFKCVSIAIGLVASMFIAGSGCTSDPASQKRIQDRNERASRAIERIKQAEARHPEKLDRTMQDISRDKQQKQEQFRETMRTLGDRFW